jgi:hypothetical protein
MTNKCLDSGNVSQRQAVSINTQEDNNIYIKNAEVCQYENSTSGNISQNSIIQSRKEK